MYLKFKKYKWRLYTVIISEHKFTRFILIMCKPLIFLTQVFFQQA